MPSSPKIPKVLILEYALKMLIRDGYESINIKALAKEIGCSTQPISWHFGNMDGLRNALPQYAQSYAISKLFNMQDNAVFSFLDLGLNYLNIAFEEPHLFRYLFMNDGSGYVASDINVFSDAGQNGEITRQLSEQLGISPELAKAYVLDLTMYAHGLASYIATGVIKISKEEAREMLIRVGTAFFAPAKGGNLS